MRTNQNLNKLMLLMNIESESGVIVGDMKLIIGEPSSKSGGDFCVHFRTDRYKCASSLSIIADTTL